jgi:hypothetical protein
MRVFQSTYRDKPTGETRRTKMWYIEFRDHNRDPKRVPGFRDRKQTEAAGRRIETLVASKLAGEAPDAAMTRWLETMPDKLRWRLTDIGLIDSRRAAASKPLSDHLEDFKAALLAKGNTEKHATLVHSRANRVVNDCGFASWSEISASKVQRFLGELRGDGNGAAAQTCNFYLQAFR